MDIRWLSIIADVPADRFDTALAYWSAVTAGEPGEPAGEDGEYVPLVPPAGDPWLWIQRVGRDQPGWHPDLHVEDVDAAVDAAQRLGARPVRSADGLRVLQTPAGQPFCFVAEDAGHTRTAPSPVAFPGGRSLADQLSLDVPARDFEAEADFWAALTGWRRRGREDEFDRIAVPATLPAQFLLQALDEDDTDGIHAHLDLSADDRDAEVARHRALGGELVRRAEGWTTLRDPVGLVYCVTGRPVGVRFT